MSDPQEEIQKTLDAAGPGVAMFSKSYCPYCMRAKQALVRSGIFPVVMELDEREDGRTIQLVLLQLTGQRTVPSAWLAGKHIGGSDDVVAGVQSGLFKSVPTKQSQEIALQAGLKKCGAEDGLPCLCYSLGS
mmetsp:Transcript_2650/g.7320  ORF Transcript_2650/g.7320 Transcript_2650/m.7320 type:complete len:132 (-) Transcript_2650:3132-3527(-)|eukprot:CAMPEP_0168783618 /NCGR_PEP_ID=MMETSP0725-20121227/9789_1 /TAXON_ID=265536 /ORGANISM="Amphiprora sp., Strain CCMP467" /LENGTH=131 /DNA_ID=CAMNT_0008833621 /DNA_START=120 /DNA_END=515 /DNA_ORIENTATION=-